MLIGAIIVDKGSKQQALIKYICIVIVLQCSNHVVLIHDTCCLLRCNKWCPISKLKVSNPTTCMSEGPLPSRGHSKTRGRAKEVNLGLGRTIFLDI